MHPLKPLALNLRKQQTDAETILWVHIKNRQIDGVKFRRQVPMGNYIADFVCVKSKLIIELDGGHHNEDVKRNKDDERTKWFEIQGYTILRFWNDEVINNLPGIIERIEMTLKHSTSPCPLLKERK
ncbi:MAG TPA: endonuclease domain-containing protein [Candidatus Saccharimonadales bacterium]|nr:endonuclease domain-containing protein [Candidatus Saccharimonadales bacterium]